MDPRLASLLALVVVASRYVAQLRPLWDRIPARWRWLPPAVVAAAGALSQAFPALGTAQGAPWLDAAVLVALAAMGGAHGPSDPPAPPREGGGAGTATLAMFVAVACLSACGSGAIAPCSRAAYAAIDTGCQEAAILAARGCVTQNVDLDECPAWIAARGICRDRFEAQEARCPSR